MGTYGQRQTPRSAMPRQHCYDVPGGDTVLYDIVDESNGYRQHTFMLKEEERYDHFFNIRKVQCKEDDIFLNSYPKTGTNWLWEMLNMMVNKTSNVGGGNKGDGMMEARPLAVLDDLTSPRILNTHVKVQYLPKEAVEKKIKTILICRNPKDVVVSFYNHTKGLKPYQYAGKFENYLQMFMRGEVDYGSYPEYLLEWQQHIRDNPDIPLHILHYEDLKKDCAAELKKIKTFLKLDITDDLVEAIAENCSIDKMRAGKASAETPEGAKMREGMLKEGFNMLRKGQVADWKNWFTVAQSEMFDAWWEKETKGLDMFKFRYT